MHCLRNQHVYGVLVNFTNKNYDFYPRCTEEIQFIFRSSIRCVKGFIKERSSVFVQHKVLL